MPEGDACQPDGTLKDASEMEWLHSPSDLNPPESRESSIGLKRKLANDEGDSSDENGDLPKTKVTYNLCFSLVADEAQIQRKSNWVLDSDNEVELASLRSKVQTQKVSSETDFWTVKYSLLFD